MKQLFLLFMIAAALCSAQTASKKQASKPAAKPAAEKPTVIKGATVEIPKDAVQFSPNQWRYTDAQGKQWIYRKTPFGVSRAEDSRAKTVDAPPAGAAIKVIDNGGDTLVFERPGPFGVYRWERKKSELKDDERAAWEKQSASGKQNEKQD